MTNRKMDLERKINPQDPSGRRMFYEVFPMPITIAAYMDEQWFEIALHIEVEGPRARDHPESRRAFSILTSLADLLIQSVRPYAPYNLEMPPCYYTLHPVESGHPASPRLARTLSLVFTDISPNRVHDGLGILARLESELAFLGVPHLQNASGRVCK